MRVLVAVACGLAFASPARAQNHCGETIAWDNPLCQIIQSGSLGSQWTVISRHGEYAQSETECNLPSAIAQIPGAVSITTTATPYTCGNFNANATVNTQPQSWPYSTGDIQFNTFKFSPNGSGGSANCQGACAITVVGSMPSVNSGLWPAFWLLGSNCQDSNKWSGDTGFDGCPNLGSSGYTEIDMTECYGQNGWCQFHVANPSFGIGNGCDAVYQVDTNPHTFKTVWTATDVKQYMDGVLETTCNQAMTNPMFFIAQIQTGGAGGTPVDGNLPASVVVNSVTISDSNGTVLFTDSFDGGATVVDGGIDAGTSDAGGAADGGGLADSGTRQDAGPASDGGTVPAPGSKGCSCGTGTEVPLAWLAALAVAWRHRRRTSAR